MSKNAMIIYTNGEVREVSPKTPPYFSLKEMQTAVGGYIENVYLDDGKIMVVNEEGKLNNLPVNAVATELYNNPLDVIVGDVLVADISFFELG